MSREREREIRERIEETRARENAIWPAAMGYTEAAMYCKWHREDVGDALSIIDELREALEAVEPMLSLLRYRGMGHSPSAWDSIGLPSQHEVDAAIGKARRVLGW